MFYPFFSYHWPQADWPQALRYCYPRWANELQYLEKKPQKTDNHRNCIS